MGATATEGLVTLRKPHLFTRRRVLMAGISLPIPLFLVGCTSNDGDPTPTGSSGTGETPTSAGTTRAGATTAAASTSTPQPMTVAATPACVDDDDEPTPAQTEGPYFTPNSPERTILFESGMGGTKLLLTGTVVSTGCRPIARALIDVWQCDNEGNYDEVGHRLRGHQFTDSSGSYRLETIVPALYGGRTRHIHVKVQAPNEPVLTTQLYFPDEARNRQDRIYRAECEIVDYVDGSGGKTGAFQFVLDV